MFELTKELKAAKTAVEQAKKDAKALAEVGVTPTEIQTAKKQFDAIYDQRQLLGEKLAEYHGDVRALVREGKLLITTVKQRIALALMWDLSENEWLKQQAGIGLRHHFSAPDVAHAARMLSETIADPRWQRALRKRGVTAAHGKRLGEIADALDEAGRAPTGNGKGVPPEFHDLMRNLGYLRQAAATLWGPHSAKFQPYRSPVYRAERPVLAAEEPASPS